MQNDFRIRLNFIDGKSSPGEDIAKWNREWARLDIVVLTSRDLCQQEALRQYWQVFGEMKARAVGDIAGIFLDSDGLEVPLTGFRRNGIGYDDLRRVKLGGGSVLVAGTPNNGGSPVNLATTLAALRGGLVSTLVCDRELAWSVLKEHVATVGE